MCKNAQSVTTSHVVTEIADENYYLNGGINIMLQLKQCVELTRNYSMCQNAQLVTTTHVVLDIPGENYYIT